MGRIAPQNTLSGPCAALNARTSEAMLTDTMEPTDVSFRGCSSVDATDAGREAAHVVWTSQSPGLGEVVSRVSDRVCVSLLCPRAQSSQKVTCVAAEAGPSAPSRIGSCRLGGASYEAVHTKLWRSRDIPLVGYHRMRARRSSRQSVAENAQSSHAVRASVFSVCSLASLVRGISTILLMRAIMSIVWFHSSRHHGKYRSHQVIEYTVLNRVALRSSRRDYTPCKMTLPSYAWASSARARRAAGRLRGIINRCRGAPSQETPTE